VNAANNQPVGRKDLFAILQSKSEFGRICGVKRRKPGFPLQFLDPPYGGSAGFPLQSRSHGRAATRRVATSPLRAQGLSGY
jgi:hypothetical protein